MRTARRAPPAATKYQSPRAMMPMPFIPQRNTLNGNIALLFFLIVTKNQSSTRNNQMNKFSASSLNAVIKDTSHYYSNPWLDFCLSLFSGTFSSYQQLYIFFLLGNEYYMIHEFLFWPLWPAQELNLVCNCRKYPQLRFQIQWSPPCFTWLLLF